MSFPVLETWICLSVQGRALFPHRDKKFVPKRIVHAPHHDPPVFFQPDGHATDGHAMGKVDRAVQRIHHPAVPRRGRVKTPIPPSKTHDRETRPANTEDLLFRRMIHGGHDIDHPLVGNGNGPHGRPAGEWRRPRPTRAEARAAKKREWDGFSHGRTSRETGVYDAWPTE
jgi:hypothetical protein